MIMGMTNRIRDRTIAPPLVPGSRNTGRLLFSDIFSAVVDFIVLISFCIKALLLAVVNGETLLVADWTLIADGEKADALWPDIIAAMAHTQMVNIDLAMIKVIVGWLNCNWLFCNSVGRRFSTWK